MASSWFFVLLLKCIDFLSWPVLALGNHLCASIEAIESDIHSETRNLISYLILEEAIVFVQTHRGRLLMEQKDIKDLEMIEKEVPEGNQANIAMDRLKSNESTSSAMAEIEKMLADIERGTYPQICACENELKEWTCAICQLTVSSESNLNFHLRGRKHKAALKALNMNTKAMSIKDRRNQAYLQVHASKNGQKTWTCTVCQLTKLSEAIVKSHVEGKKHKAACEALNMKTKAMSMKDKRNQACLQVHASKNGQKTWTCTVCHLTKLSEANVKSHLQGKKHKAACEALEMKGCIESFAEEWPVLALGYHLCASIEEIESDSHSETRNSISYLIPEEAIVFVQTNRGRLLMEQKDIKDLEMIEKEVPEGNQANAAMDRLKSNESTSSAMAEIEKMLADIERGTYPQICACENELKEWTCAICQLTVSSESNLNFHLRGRKHKAACKALNMKTKAMSMKDRRNQAYLQVHASKNGQKTWTCTVCQLTKLSEAIVKSHVEGKKHKAACEALNMKTKAMLMKDKRNEACLWVHASKNGQKTWTCTVCHLTKLSEANVKSHLQGKKHKAACEALDMKGCIESFAEEW